MPEDPPLSPPPPDARPPRRPVYQSTLLPERTRRRIPPWVAVPVLLLVLGGVFLFLLASPHRRRALPTAGQMVYASDAGTPGTPHLFVANSDGTNARRLTTQTGPETAPAWSPDGVQIAFLAPGAGGANQVWTVDADGQNFQAVTRTAGDKTRPRFSPADPNLLAFGTGGALSVADVNTGSADRVLPPPPEASSHAQDPDAVRSVSPNVTVTDYAWIPSADKTAPGLAAAEDAGGVQALLLLPALSGKPFDSTPSGGPLAAADTLSVAASPDGAHLAVALLGVRGLPKGRALSALLLFDPSGQASGQRPLAAVNRADTGPQNPVFSPDGTQIAFELWNVPDIARRRTVGLFVVPADGSSPPRPVFRGDAGGACWTADGAALLFTVRRPDGGHDLCRVGADGQGFARLSDGQADVTSAAASPQKPT